MPLQRIRATALARLFNSVERPIYVLDGEGTIVFCNQPLLTAIGPAATDLLGRRCVYHAKRERDADATAAGLCPPPRAMAGQAASGSVSWIDADGILQQRWARFIPLCDTPAPRGTTDEDAVADVIGIVALVDPSDTPRSEPLVSESDDLHRRVCEFQRTMANAHRVDRLIGDSPAMRRARRQVELAAAMRAGVSLIGPPGSGRQHIAKAIHYADHAPVGDNAAGVKETDGSLIPLACAVLGPDLIRSTVTALGGASLGASARQGTLLLNEADELPTEVQAELAAIFSRANFPARLISTARRPLDKLAAEGKFREDLASLLSTIVIELPPLAHRRADLPLLAQMFVEKENSRGEKQIGGLTTEALDLLDGYDWPGNVDELALMIAEAHKTAESAVITADDLPKTIHLAAGAAARPHRPIETIVLDEYLAQIERELLQRAIKQAKGNKAKAARMLGLSRPRLYRRLVQLGLEKGKAEKDLLEQIDFQSVDDDEQEY